MLVARRILLGVSTAMVLTFYYGVVYGAALALALALAYRVGPATGRRERRLALAVIALASCEATLGAGVMIFQSDWSIAALGIGVLAVIATRRFWAMGVTPSVTTTPAEA